MDINDTWLPAELVGLIKEYRPRYRVDPNVPDALKIYKPVAIDDAKVLCEQLPSYQDIAAVDTVRDLCDGPHAEYLDLTSLYSTNYSPMAKLAMQLYSMPGNGHYFMESNLDELVSFGKQLNANAPFVQYSASNISTKHFIQHPEQILHVGHWPKWIENHNPEASAYTISHLDKFNIRYPVMLGSDEVVKELISRGMYTDEIVCNKTKTAYDAVMSHIDRFDQRTLDTFVLFHGDDQEVIDMVKRIGMDKFGPYGIFMCEDPEIVSYVLNHSEPNETFADDFMCNPMMYDWLIAHPDRIYKHNNKQLSGNKKYIQLYDP